MGNTNNDYYAILDVPKNATPEQIKKAYVDLVKVWHPDRFAHDPGLQTRAQEKLKAINEAYGVLSNANRRSDYDAQIGRTTSHQQSGSQTRSAPPRPVSPDIRISVSTLDFGIVTKGQTKKLSFTISNVGGPSHTHNLGFGGSPDWVDASMLEDPTSVFPIKVTLTISAKASIGDHKDVIVVAVDGKLHAQIPVSVTVKAVTKTQTAAAKPVSAKRTTTPHKHSPRKTSYASSTPVNKTATPGGNSLGVVITVLVSVGIVGFISLVAYSNYDYNRRMEAENAAGVALLDSVQGSIVEAKHIPCNPESGNINCVQFTVKNDWYDTIVVNTNYSGYDFDQDGYVFRGTQCRGQYWEDIEAGQSLTYICTSGDVLIDSICVDLRIRTGNSVDLSGATYAKTICSPIN